jgi:hypothetical protein
MEIKNQSDEEQHIKTKDTVFWIWYAIKNEHEPIKDDRYKNHCLASKITTIYKYHTDWFLNIDRL